MSVRKFFKEDLLSDIIRVRPGARFAKLDWTHKSESLPINLREGSAPSRKKRRPFTPAKGDTWSPKPPLLYFFPRGHENIEIALLSGLVTMLPKQK